MIVSMYRQDISPVVVERSASVSTLNDDLSPWLFEVDARAESITLIEGKGGGGGGGGARRTA